MLQSSVSGPAAVLLLAGSLLLSIASTASASTFAFTSTSGSTSVAVSVAGVHTDESMPGMDHGSMPGMDHGSMPGMDHGSMPGMDHGTSSATGDRHDGVASGSSQRPLVLVLALFAGFNAAVMAAAAVVRRRTAARRPGGRPRPRRAGAAVA